jgi:hypothetical protein
MSVVALVLAPWFVRVHAGDALDVGMMLEAARAVLGLG